MTPILVDGAERQTHYNTYKFEKSMVDRLSIHVANQWEQAVEKKKLLLIHKMQVHAHFEEMIKKVIKTKLPEQHVTCPSLNCESSNVDVPLFGVLDNNDKGHLFISCSGCGRTIWLIEDAQENNVQTVEAFNENFNPSKS